MWRMRAPIVALTVVCLTSCVTNINNKPPLRQRHGHIRIYILTDSKGMVECPPYDPPEIPLMPAIPLIPDTSLGKREAEEDILIKSLKDHRHYIRSLKKQLQSNFQDYVDDCLE